MRKGCPVNYRNIYSGKAKLKGFECVYFYPKHPNRVFWGYVKLPMTLGGCNIISPDPSYENGQNGILHESLD